jgi:chitin synthase
MSLMSVATDVTAASRPVVTGTLTSNNVMSSLNHVYNQAKAYQLDAGTSVVVNTWATAASGNGSTVDTSLAEKALQHAIRRAEDGCVVLA